MMKSKYEIGDEVYTATGGKIYKSTISNRKHEFDEKGGIDNYFYDTEDPGGLYHQPELLIYDTFQDAIDSFLERHCCDKIKRNYKLRVIGIKE